MDISAKDVMKLRSATGMGMMACKKALLEAEGNFDNAVDLLRKKGLKAAEKKADRATGEGLIGHIMSDDASTGTMVLVLCETEPVKNTPIFQELVQGITQVADTAAPADTDGLLAAPWPGEDASTVDEAVKRMIGQIGENMRVHAYSRFAQSEGIVGAYVHHDKKTGAMVSVKGSGELKDFAKKLCMHIVFSKPTVMRREDIDAAEVDRELAFLREQIADDASMKGKPEAALEGIVQGRLSKNFFGARALLEQPWFDDNSTRVSAKAKEAGCEIEAFALFQPSA